MQTVTLRLPIESENLQALKETAIQFSESFARVCLEGWNSQRVNGVELHHLTYQRERQITSLPSQLVCSARMKATEALKSAKAKLKKGKKASCPTGKTITVRYDARSATVRLDKGIASLASIDGRVKVSLAICDYYQRYVSWKVCSSDLCFKQNGRVFLHVVVSADNPVVEPSGTTIGVDLGVNRPAVTSNADFLGKRQWKETTKKYFRIKRALQAKDTDSAKRHLKKLSQKENRFRKDCDHVISRRIVDAVEPGSIIVLEDLVNIRGRVKAKRKQRRRIHSWSFARLQSFLDYKGRMRGLTVECVDPRYTSQKCYRCGHIERGNRQSQSWFVCKSCGFQHNADLNAAKNIRQNYLASKGMSAGSRADVNQPIVGSTYKPSPLGDGS
jgi:putative transposase